MPIRVGLAAGAIASILLTAALVHIPWSITARGNTAELTRRINDQIIAGLGDKVNALLAGAMATQQAIATNLAQGVIDLGNMAQRQTFFLSYLQSQPTLSSIELIWPDDHAFRTRRIDDHTVTMEETRPVGERSATGRRINRYQLDGQGRATLLGRDAAPAVEPATQQFWYRLAYGNETAAWSNIYPMADGGTLGFTAARSLVLPDGQIGVLSVAIELQRIWSFLRNIEVSAHGAVFVTNRYAELVAAQPNADGSGMMGPPTGKIGRLADSDLPMVRIAVAALAASEVTLRDLQTPRQVSFRDPATGETYFVTVAPLAEMELAVALVVPERDILSSINRNTRFLAWALGGFILLVAAAVVLAARRSLASPLVQVTKSARQLGLFRFDEVRPIGSRVTEIQTLSTAIGQMSASLSSFRKYVPTEVVRMLFAQGIEAELGGERRDLSILFMDLADFTRISEALGDELIPFLAVYLSEMSATLRAGDATIDKYIGDAIMAFWGAPIATERHAILACRAALACQEHLSGIRRQRAPLGGPEIRVRIGINTGRVLVGNVGSNERLNYTAIGDPVNVASRLEALNKLYGTEILIGEDTYRRVEGEVVARRLDRVAVYGKAQGVAIYELVGLVSSVSADTHAWIALFDDGMRAMAARRWEAAIACFERVIERRGGSDRASSLLIERARGYASTPPPPDWDGLVVLAEK